jgi:predicted double-glycine peptidase
LYAGLAVGPAEGFESWVQLRDHGVVRQERDFSCGLAALATLLAADGEAGITESVLLSELEALHADAAISRIERGGVSFADLALLAQAHGRRAVGVQLPVSGLRRVRGPAIVALQVNGRPHFSLLRAVRPDGAVWLADPTWGNRRLSAPAFTRAFSGADGRGRALLVSAAAPDAAPLGERQGWLTSIYLAPRL